MADAEQFGAVFLDHRRDDVPFHLGNCRLVTGRVVLVCGALNGGPRFKFTEAVSFVVNCETQAEIDYYWERLTSGGGEEVQCGWLTDKYGLSWQIVPTKFAEWARDAAGFQRVMHAVMPMKKLDVAALQRAYDGK
jgi:predicted 3-demethylubiquinone-9 3-methyltransferase (glyoxalase superfamily)